MKNKYDTPIQINNDEHLKDILKKDYYLELGIIDVDILESLLNKDIIDVEKITYYPIQNKGLGSFTVTESNLRNDLPFIFFSQMANINSQYQIVITYGLYKFRRKDKVEKFIPVILIPIKIYNENNKLLIQIERKPFANPLLYTVFNNTSRISFLQTESYDSVYSLDNILKQLDKLSVQSVRIDNYITFIQKKTREIILPSKKILNNTNSIIVENCKTYESSDNYYYSRILNKDQRIFLKKAMNSENLTLTGYTGTGKTTILKNIIINKLAQKEQILYISDSKESINDMENFLFSLGLDKYVLNVCKSTNKTVQSNTLEKKATFDVSDIKEKISEYYKYLDNFEKTMNESFSDFKFVDLLKRFFMIPSFDTTKHNRLVVKDDLNYIYKHEYKSIREALELIETNSKKIVSFKNSVWNQIPILNNIKYVNQVVNVVFKLHNGLKKLRELEIRLETYGVKPIQSFSGMKKCLGEMDKLIIDSVPRKWLQSTLVFQEAKDAFNDLKEDITTYQEIEYFLSTKYKNLSSINIDKEINTIYGDFYRTDDVNIIEELIRTRKDVNSEKYKSLNNIKNYEESAKKIEKELDWTFVQSDQSINEIITLITLLNDYQIYGKFLSIIINGKETQVKKQLYEIYKSINRLIEESESLINDNPKLAKKRTNNPKSIELFNELDLKQKKIKRLEKDYIEYCGDNYKNYENDIKAIDSLKIYYESLRKKNFRKKIVDFILHIERNNRHQTMSTLNLFLNSYKKINEDALFLEKYKLDTNNLSMQAKIEKIKKYYSYLDNLYLSQDRLHEIIIDSGEFVMPDEYDLIKDKQSSFAYLTAVLRNNDEYIRLYEYLYTYEETNLVNVIKIMQMYESYRSVFESDEYLIKSFTVFNDIEVLIKEISSLVSSIGENLRLYSLIFKDSVSRYYFSNIEENINYLGCLLDAKDELVIYLNITQGIGVLDEYNLNSVIDYVKEYDDLDNITNEFTYLYFKNIIDRVFENKEIIRSYSKYLEILKAVIALEDELCVKENVKIINDILENNSHSIRKKDLNQKEYMKAIKSFYNKMLVVLLDSNDAQDYLASIDYDLAIIDDAQTIVEGEYNSLFQGKQVIICGDYQTNKVVNQNLISLTTSEQSTVFRKRLVPGPRALTYHIPITSCPYINTFEENYGVVTLNKDIEKYIFDLYQDNQNVKINFYVKNIDIQKKIYEKITEYFYLKGVTVIDIENFLSNNILIADVEARNYLHSDYEIIYFEDYYEENSMITSSNIFELLMTPQKALVIYDVEDRLNGEYNYQFFTSVKSLLNNKIFLKNENDQISNLLASMLEEKGYKVYFAGNGMNLSFTKEGSNDLVSLIIFFCNGFVYDVMNNYRDIYETYVNKGHKIIMRTMVDLIDGPEAFIEKVCEEYNDKRK